MDRAQRERLRRRYRPAKVRLLFIGESPPASGRFFYARDSGLYRAMREAFQSVSDETFLANFQLAGCYFVDLCPDPVDQLDARSRRDAHRAAEALLARTITRLNPEMIVTVVRAIEGNVLTAASRANWHGPVVHVPYPGRWAHLKRRFVEELAPVIETIRGPDGI